jgi:plastocyanin
MAEGLRFDPPRLEAQPGELIQLEIENVDVSHQPHNFLLVKPGQVQEVVKIAMEMGESGPNKGFIPEHPSILASSGKVVDPDGKVKLTFETPKEPGIYGYLCSVPGHGMVMYGALYVGTPMPPIAKDTNIPQLTLEKGLVGGGRRPFVQRIFMPNSGPAAIAVALPGSLNYCFDAGICRVRYVWSGPFLDGTKNWRGSGKDLPELGDIAWWSSSQPLLRIGGAKMDDALDSKFLGYVLNDGIPEFHYRIGKQEVYQTVKTSGNGLELHFRLPKNKSKVTVLMDAGAVWKCPDAMDHKGVWEVPANKAQEFSVFLEQKNPPAAKETTTPVSQNSHNHTP